MTSVIYYRTPKRIMVGEMIQVVGCAAQIRKASKVWVVPVETILASPIRKLSNYQDGKVRKALKE